MNGSFIWCKNFGSIYFVLSQCTRVTDRQTDVDRQTVRTVGLCIRSRAVARQKQICLHSLGGANLLAFILIQYMAINEGKQI